MNVGRDEDGALLWVDNNCRNYFEMEQLKVGGWVRGVCVRKICWGMGVGVMWVSVARWAARWRSSSGWRCDDS